LSSRELGGELEFELCRVDALGLCQDELAPRELNLELERVIRSRSRSRSASASTRRERSASNPASATATFASGSTSLAAMTGLVVLGVPSIPAHRYSRY
jgi:hypothetical protein